MEAPWKSVISVIMPQLVKDIGLIGPLQQPITHMLMYCYKTTAYNTLDHSVLPPMWQQFVFGSAVFQQDKVPLCTKPDP